MQSFRALVFALLASLLYCCAPVQHVPGHSTECPARTPSEMAEFERFAYELRNGADVVLTWGSYGRDFWWETNIERTWDIKEGEDVIQYFLPFPLVRDENVLQISGDYIHAERIGVGEHKDNFWIVVYDPPPNGQVRGHIAFQSYGEDQWYVPSRYVVMIKDPKGSSDRKQPVAVPPPTDENSDGIMRHYPWTPPPGAR